MDKVGNRELEVVDSGGVLNTLDYGYNNRDQLTSVTDSDGLDITYDYDAFGNQTEKNTNGVITTFDYTARQRVKIITIGTASPNEYEYDYAGQRVNSQTNGMEKHYLYDGLTLVAETNAIGNTLATYHYGQRRQLAETRNGTNSYYLADALGTNVAITNQDGSIQNRMDYDVWGNLNQETGSSESPFGFTGYIRDEDTDLYYANARYYDSFTGRFLREDPWEGKYLRPTSLHRYNYTASNPTAFIDPTGNGDVTPHFYESLLMADIANLTNNEAYAFAIGSQAGDEFKKHDAMENSFGLVATIIGALQSPFLTTDYYHEYDHTVINNCGNHALCNTSATYVREAFKYYVDNYVTNLAEYGSGDHANADSFYHITLETLGTDKEMSPNAVVGHGPDGTSTDKAYRFFDSKRIKAFRSRAISLYKYSLRNGKTDLSEKEFQRRLGLTISELIDQNNQLLDENGPFPYTHKFNTNIDSNDEYTMMREILEKRGFTNITKPEDYPVDHDMSQILGSMGIERLRGIANEINPNASVRIGELSKDRLIVYISHKYDRYQSKSRDIIYNETMRLKAEHEWIMESKTKSGVEEISQ